MFSYTATKNNAVALKQIWVSESRKCFWICSLQNGDIYFPMCQEMKWLLRLIEIQIFKFTLPAMKSYLSKFSTSETLTRYFSYNALQMYFMFMVVLNDFIYNCLKRG